MATTPNILVRDMPAAVHVMSLQPCSLDDYVEALHGIPLHAYSGFAAACDPTCMHWQACTWVKLLADACACMRVLVCVVCAGPNSVCVRASVRARAGPNTEWPVVCPGLMHCLCADVLELPEIVTWGSMLLSVCRLFVCCLCTGAIACVSAVKVLPAGHRAPTCCRDVVHGDC